MLSEKIILFGQGKENGNMVQDNKKSSYSGFKLMQSIRELNRRLQKVPLEPYRRFKGNKNWLKINKILKF